jgi:hypothetical protein
MVRRRIGSPRGSRTPVLADTQAGLTSVFGMGTGVAPPLWPPSCRPTESNRRDASVGGPIPYVRAIQFAPGPDNRSGHSANQMNVARTVSARGLNVSLPRRVHPESIELVFYECPRWYFFSRWVSSLDAFSSYPVVRGCPATALSDNRYTSGTHAEFLSYYTPVPVKYLTPPIDSSRPVSRRSKPSSRPPLIGEQPHPCPLLHGQDGGNRHRGSKPLGRYVLLRVTTLLSLR